MLSILSNELENNCPAHLHIQKWGHVLILNFNLQLTVAYLGLTFLIMLSVLGYWQLQQAVWLDLYIRFPCLEAHSFVLSLHLDTTLTPDKCFYDKKLLVYTCGGIPGGAVNASCCISTNWISIQKWLHMVLKFLGVFQSIWSVQWKPGYKNYDET